MVLKLLPEGEVFAEGVNAELDVKEERVEFSSFDGVAGLDDFLQLLPA